MNKFLHTLPFLLLILIALLTILSWIGNVYGMDVQNLLSADGIRWAVGNILPNFNAAPIVATLISMMTLSIVIESDLLPVIASCFTHRRRSRRTLKQRRAFQYAAIVFVAGILLILALTLPVGSVLLSAFGTFEGSPLQDGLYPLLLLLLFLSATTYGFAAGCFFSLSDIVQATAWLPARLSSYWLTMLISSQFLATLRYVFRLEDSSFLLCCSSFLYVIPLLFHLYEVRKSLTH